MFTFILCMLIFISPLEIVCILGLQTTVADVIGVCFIRNDLTYTKVISGWYQIKWVLFIALFFCGFSDIFPLVFLSHNHIFYITFWNSLLRRRISRISFFFSLNNLCMFTYSYILPFFETASQFQSWHLSWL